MVEVGKIDGYLCATAFTTFHYLAKKLVGEERARLDLIRLMTFFRVAPVDIGVLTRAVETQMADFEDAVVVAAALHVGAEAIVTRNSRDYSQSDVRVYEPLGLLNVLTRTERGTE